MARRWLPLLLSLFVLGCGEEPVADETRDGGGVADAGPRDGGRGDAAFNDAAIDDAGRDASPEDAGPEDASADGGPEDAGRGSCSDGIRNGDEADVDCGGSCETCANGARCGGASDCRSERCVDAECRSPEGTHPDIVRVLDVPGRNPGGRSWADSYSVGSECYCATSFDHGIGPIEVPTPAGPRTVRDVCDALGPGPGLDGRPLYNDVQCGNGPPNDAGDEDDCPGRVDIGRDGCGHVGPSWNLGRI